MSGLVFSYVPVLPLDPPVSTQYRERASSASRPAAPLHREQGPGHASRLTAPPPVRAAGWPDCLSEPPPPVRAAAWPDHHRLGGLPPPGVTPRC